MVLSSIRWMDTLISPEKREGVSRQAHFVTPASSLTAMR
jgi:hypothetical protein